MISSFEIQGRARCPQRAASVNNAPKSLTPVERTLRTTQ